MPFQPPVIGGYKGKAWAVTAGRPDKRKRGRAGQRERHQVLAEEPLCRKCLAAGREVATDVVDHIVPLAWGGADTRGNKQGLCDPCHDAKSAEERAIDRSCRS